MQIRIQLAERNETHLDLLQSRPVHQSDVEPIQTCLDIHIPIYVYISTKFDFERRITNCLNPFFKSNNVTLI